MNGAYFKTTPIGIIVFGLQDLVPGNVEELEVVKMDDSGFSAILM